MNLLPLRAAVPDQRPAPSAGERVATRRRYVLCPPEHFAVRYAINPWMDPDVPVDRDLALRQWSALRAAYEALGHEVLVLDALPGLPDMVFAANGAVVAGGRALGSRYRFAERAAEAPAHLALLEELVARGELRAVVPAEHVVEGEGDLLVVGDLVLAGHGFRTDPRAHAQAQEVLGRPVVGLRLVDPRYYHLDTALGVLADGEVAYVPSAFSPGSREVLARLFPDAVLCDEREASVLALNLVSDGRSVVMTDRAPRLAAALADRGFVPVPVDLSELLKAGGGVKCCTLELRG